MKIGVFICKCGSNIAATVDVDKVAEAALQFPDVVYSSVNMYTCSEPGQQSIIDAIHEYKLDAIVVASCSPRMHEMTFRRTIDRAGLNQYMLEMANIREHVSWIGKDMNANSEKAIDLVMIASEKVRHNKALFSKEFEITKKVLVIGGGIAGIQASLDCADADIEVVLVEKDATIGGKMARLDKTFPTIDCSSCVLSPKMVDVAQHDNIELHAYSEIEKIEGYVGNYTVTIRKKATYVDWESCTGCGECIEKCPQKDFDSFNEGLGERKAVSIPFPQAIPRRATINPKACRKLLSGKCGICEKICKAKSVNYEMEDSFITVKVGAIITATGYDLYDHTKLAEYEYGKNPDILTSLQYERLISASGPTGGHIKRPSDGREPKNIVFVQCVGSRDKSINRPICSSFCCMYTAKQAILTKDHIPDSTSYVFYMDIRAGGKAYDEFTRRAIEEYDVQYIRGRVSTVQTTIDEDGVKHYIVRGADTLLGQQVEVVADMIVLAVGVQGSDKAEELAEKLHISYDADNFYLEGHVKLKPVETNTAGVFLAGVCQGPKDIPASVAQASGAAAKAIGLLSKPKLKGDPQVASVTLKRCVGCGKCVKVCPYQAIKEIDFRGAVKAEVIETVCQGCGVCNATCPQGAIQLAHFTDNQILAEVEALCQ